MSELNWRAIRQLVYEPAQGCCEYCQTCEVNTGQTMQVDHVDPDGGDGLNNLCLACWNCNNYKRRAVTAIDADTGKVEPLFNPRRQTWNEHFEWSDDATHIAGLTPTGRVTVERLKMNRLTVVIARQRWAAGGYHPPAGMSGDRTP